MGFALCVMFNWFVMYLNCFDLRHRPFSITPDLDFMYWSESHRRAFDTLKSEVLGNAPVTALIGKTGSGKTLLTIALLNDPEIQENHRVLLLTNMRGNAVEIRQRLTLALGGAVTQAPSSKDVAQGLDEIRETGKTPVIFADEAQSLSPEGAEVLVDISNNSNPGHLPILIAGQTKLATILKQPGYQELQKMIGETVHLPDLPVEEVEAYIRSRLNQAGAKADLFTPEAIRKIHIKSSGIPRLVNKLCEVLLYLASQEDLSVIDGSTALRLMNDNIDPVTLALRPGAKTERFLLEPFQSVTKPIAPLKKKTGKPDTLVLASPLKTETVPQPSANTAVPAQAPRKKRVLAAAAGCLAAIVILLNPWARSVLTESPEIPLISDEGAVGLDQPPALNTEPFESEDQGQGTVSTAQASEPLPDAPEKVEDFSALLKPVTTQATTEADTFFQDALNSSDNKDMAVLYARAALRGHDRAARYLAQMFETGDGVAYAPSVAAQWYGVTGDEIAYGDTGALSVAGVAVPLFSEMSPDELELVWDGHGPSFTVEFADGAGQVLGRFDTRLTAVRLRRPEAAVSWRVTGEGSAPGDWQTIDNAE